MNQPCTKRSYADIRQVENVLRNLKREKGYRGKAYVCPQCGLLHIGRKRKDVRKEGKYQ